MYVINIKIFSQVIMFYIFIRLAELLCIDLFLNIKFSVRTSENLDFHTTVQNTMKLNSKCGKHLNFLGRLAGLSYSKPAKMNVLILGI